MKAIYSVALLALSTGFLACGGDDSDLTPGGNADGGASGDGGGAGDNQGSVPDPVAQSGVAYVAHYLGQPSDGTRRLNWYRTSGAAPVMEGFLDLGAFTQDLDLDPVNNLLVAVSDASKSATLYRLSRPASADAPVTAPQQAGRITFAEGLPVFVEFNPYKQRMYVAVSPIAKGVVTEHFLHAYDVSDPDAPSEIDGSPYTIPASVSWALDPARDLMWLVSLRDDLLHGYDLSDAGLRPLPGDPIDLRVLYPEENQNGFQARNLVADAKSNRVFAARSQGILSELISFRYPEDVPRNGARYGDFVSMSDLVKLDDPMDLQLPGDERQNYLDAYQVGIDPTSGAVFMSADAWNGSASTAMVAAYSPDLSQLAPGCEDFEGFGCFVRSYSAGAAGPYLRTDSAMCVDFTNKVVMATSVAPSEDEPGMVHFFKYQSDLSMTPWLPEDGGNLIASALPIGAVCH